MRSTFQTKIQDKRVYPVLDAIAALFGSLMRRLFVDLYVRGCKPSECKKRYIARYGLTARQFNSIAYELAGRVRAAEKSRKLRIAALEGQIAAAEKAIRRLRKEEKRLASCKGKAAGMKPHERVARRWRVRRALHQKKRRLCMLQDRLHRLRREQEHQSPPSLCFGSRRLFRAQFYLAENGFISHDEWLRKWREARSNAFFCIGSRGEKGGNETCTLLRDGTLRLRVPPALEKQYGKYVLIPGVRFPYGQEVIEAALATGQAISYRFVRKHGVWYLLATTERPVPEPVTSRHAGAVGVDLNPDRVAVAEVDRSGNPVASRDIRIQVQGRRREQVQAILGDVVADVVAWARGAGKPVVVERLDFRAKRARLREVSDRYARKLSHFAYATFHALLASRAAREGVEVIEVDPAYTSKIGKAKFMARYGLSPHAAAAVAIARRGLGFRDRLRSGSARPLPARNRGRHVRSNRSRFLNVCGFSPAHAQRPSEGGPGRGIPLSAAGDSLQRDGLAWAPGCDPPARIAGSAVRPAS